MSFRHQHSGELHRHVAFYRKFPPTPILRGTPSQYKRRNNGSASVLSQYASGRTTSNSKHSHRFPVHRRFPVVVQHQVPTIQTVQSRWMYLTASIWIGVYVPEERPRKVPTNQKIQRTVERTQVRVHRDMYRSSGRSRRLLRHHRNSCGRFRGSSSSRRRLSTRQVLVIQSPEDRVMSDRYRTWTWSSIMVMTVDFPLVLQHQVQTILTMQR